MQLGGCSDPLLGMQSLVEINTKHQLDLKKKSLFFLIELKISKYQKLDSSFEYKTWICEHPNMIHTHSSILRWENHAYWLIIQVFSLNKKNKKDSPGDCCWLIFWVWLIVMMKLICSRLVFIFMGETRQRQNSKECVINSMMGKTDR